MESICTRTNTFSHRWLSFLITSSFHVSSRSTMAIAMWSISPVGISSWHWCLGSSASTPEEVLPSWSWQTCHTEQPCQGKRKSWLSHLRGFCLLHDRAGLKEKSKRHLQTWWQRVCFGPTTIDLCLQMFPWAKFRMHKGGIKVHTLYDVETQHLSSFI